MASGSSQDVSVASQDNEKVPIVPLDSYTDLQRILHLEKRLQDFSTCFRLLWPIEDEEPEITMPPLHYACKCGDLELVKLLARGIPVETVAEIQSEELFEETFFTPLMLAAKYGKVKIMGFLISMLPSNAVKTNSQNGVPLLEFAAYGGLRAFNLIRNRLVGSLRREQLKKCAEAAASGGQIPLLQEIRTELKEVAFSALSDELATWAAKKGRLEVLQWLKAQQIDWKSDISEEAAFFGHVGILEWLQATNIEMDEKEVVLCAIYGDSLPVLEHMKSKGFKLDVTTLPWTCDVYDPDGTYENLNALHHMARMGRLELLRWAKLQNLAMNPVSSSCGPTLGQVAALFDQIDVLDWLEEEDLVEESSRWHVLAAAMTGGSVEVVTKYLKPSYVHYRDEKGRNLGHYLAVNADPDLLSKILGLLLPRHFRYCYDFDGNSPLHIAAAADNLGALKLMKPSAPPEAWSKTNRNGFTVTACAASSGSVNMLTWLKDNTVLNVGPPKAYIDAIAARNYDAYRWMKINAKLVIPVFEWASAGDLEAFQFLARSEVVSVDALFGAAFYGHNQIIDYCLGPECSIELDDDAALHAAQGQKLETLHHLKALGVDFTLFEDDEGNDLVTSALKDPPPNSAVLKFLDEQGCDMTKAKQAGLVW